MPQNQAGSVYVPEVQTPGYYDQQEQVRQAQAMTLQAAVEKRNADMAAQQKQQEQDAYLKDAYARFTQVDGTGRPDMDAIVQDAYKNGRVELAQDLEKRVATDRAQGAKLRMEFLQAQELEGKLGLDALNRMTETNYHILLPRLQKTDPELAQQLGPTFNPQLVDSLKTQGSDKAARLEAIQLVYGKDPRQGVLMDLADSATPEDWEDGWLGVEKFYGPSVTAQMRKQFGDFTPENIAKIQAELGAGQKQTGAPTSDYSRFLERYAASIGKTVDQITAKDEIAAKKAYGQADDKVTVVGGQAGLSPAMESNVLNRITTQWATAKKPAEELHRQAELMRVGMDAARKGNMAQGAQAVLVTFQKILDPTSVVRESEYERSAAGQSLVNRVAGAMERLAKGGTGVRLDELEKFYQLAQEAVKAQTGAYLSSTKERIGRTADRYKIPRDIVFEDMDVTTGSAQPKGGGAVRVKGADGKTYEFPNQAAADAFKKAGG